MVLGRRFYQKDTLKVAQNLLGCFLIRQIGKKKVKGIIMETEAYIGEDDLASHASKGKTPRTEIMYGEAGHAYVYMVYGVYHCLNIVTENKNFPAAVLIRGVANIEINSKSNPLFYSPPLKGGEDIVLDGPGKLCKFFKINRKLNDWDLTKREKLWIEKPSGKSAIAKKDIKKSKRVGVDYAGKCKHYLWRFYLG